MAAIAFVIASAAAHAQASTCNQAPGPTCLYLPAASHGFALFERSTGRAMLDALALLSTAEFSGQIDMQRIALGGHSAGAGAAQTLAGAKRIFVGPPNEVSDPRPIAFLAFSPQQPGSEGSFDTRFQKERHSWTDVLRPVLTATGDGDSTCNPGAAPGNCIGDTPFGAASAA